MSVLLSLSGLVDVLSVCVLFLGLMCAGASRLLFISCQVTTEAPCLCPSRQVAFGFFVCSCCFLLGGVYCFEFGVKDKAMCLATFTNIHNSKLINWVNLFKKSAKFNMLSLITLVACTCLYSICLKYKI